MRPRLPPGLDLSAAAAAGRCSHRRSRVSADRCGAGVLRESPHFRHLARGLAPRARVRRRARPCRPRPQRTRNPRRRILRHRFRPRAADPSWRLAVGDCPGALRFLRFLPVDDPCRESRRPRRGPTRPRAAFGSCRTPIERRAPRARSSRRARRAATSAGRAARGRGARPRGCARPSSPADPRPMIRATASTVRAGRALRCLSRSCPHSGAASPSACLSRATA